LASPFIEWSWSRTKMSSAVCFCSSLDATASTRPGARWSPRQLSPGIGLLKRLPVLVLAVGATSIRTPFAAGTAGRNPAIWFALAVSSLLGTEAFLAGHRLTNRQFVDLILAPNGLQ
jgi:hypothetical protein